MFPTLLITAALTIVLGLGMPTPSAYILGAAMMGPILAQLQVPTLAAHMFILYYAVMSALTPPVAVAAYAASSIAEDNPLHIAVFAVKFALAAFIIPFAFVYGPELLMIGSPLQIIFSMVTAAAGLILLAAAIEGYLRKPLSNLMRILTSLAGIGLILPFTEMAAGAIILLAIAFLPEIFIRAAKR
jgi:TRAP-type uncharacterized transport system fused permease subunit